MRRFVIRAEDYDKVHTWLRKAARHAPVVDEKEDEKMGEVPEVVQEHTLPADLLPAIVWAHKAPFKLQKVAHGKEVIMVQERGVWKRLVHHKETDGYLRDALLSSSADVPMSRDAGYHIVQKRTVGISRRTLQRFLSKQTVLQITRDVVPEEKKPGRPLEGRGYIEIDLVEAKGKDIDKHLHVLTKNFLWITMIDRLTGWLEVETTPGKFSYLIAPRMRRMLRKMSAALRTDIKYIRSDTGGEFMGKTQTVFKELGIRHRFVKSGNRIEQANKTYQKIWYRLLRLGRGESIEDLDKQAVAIFNNTLSSINGKTPLEALDTDDKVLSAAFNASRKRAAVPKYMRATIEKGDKVRYLIMSVVGKHGVKNRELGYKSYRGKHWSEMHVVVKIRTAEIMGDVHVVTYYVGGSWRPRDQLLRVPGVDTLTRDKVLARHRRKKANYQARTGLSV